MELLGISSARKRKELRERLYAHLQEHFENIRRKEEKGIDNKKVAKRRDKITPQSLGQDVFTEIENQHPALLRGYQDFARLDNGAGVEGIRVPARGKPELVNDMLTTGVRFVMGRKSGELIETRSADQAKLILRLVELGEGGRNHFVPFDDKVIRRLIKRIDEHLRKRRETVRALIDARTGDPELRQKAFDLVMARF